MQSKIEKRKDAEKFLCIRIAQAIFGELIFTAVQGN